jgi:hypothetical protein
MRNRALKNRTAYKATMRKMDDETYKLRRSVLDVVYEAKRRGFDLPRIEVRIVSGTEVAAGYAYLGRNIIHIDERYAVGRNVLPLTLHEVVHAAFGVGRVEGCVLMDCFTSDKYYASTDVIWAKFEEYYKKWKSS